VIEGLSRRIFCKSDSSGRVGLRIAIDEERGLPSGGKAGG
jgi:hypothetical protein